MSSRNMVVSIIGRPNVGKSTIFNRLMRKAYLAMTHDMPGVTRDRHYGILKMEEGQQGEHEVILVDTGGFYTDKIDIDPVKKKNNVDPFFNIMADHAKIAISESDLVLFVVDVREGLNPFDQRIYSFIRMQKKPVWLLMNKFDSEKQEGEEIDFYELGLEPDDMLRISAEHARGINDLRERLYHRAILFKADSQKMEEQDEMLSQGVKPKHDVMGAVAFIGAPNAGKSTLLNKLVGAERALVSDIAGTTVDPIEGYMDLYFNRDLDVLKSKENAFRKSDEKLFEEFKSASSKGIDIDGDEDELEEVIMLEYGQMSPEVLAPDLDDVDSDDDLSEIETFDTSDEMSFDDYFSDEALSESLTEEEISIVDDEAAHEVITSGLRSVKLVDTAGIRRAKMVEGFIETQSVYRSLKAITESDIVVMMVDATIGVTHQDRRLCDIALEKGVSLILCLNKIDLMRDTMNDQKKKREWMRDLKATIPWLSFCQVITISAKQGRNLSALKDAIKRTIMIRGQKVPTSSLNKAVTALVDRHPVVVKRAGGSRFKVKYASMIKSAPPTFLLFSNKSQGIPDTYRRYLVSGIRKEFNIVNTPIHLIFRTSKDLERRMKKVQKKPTK